MFAQGCFQKHLEEVPLPLVFPVSACKKDTFLLPVFAAELVPVEPL